MKDDKLTRRQFVQTAAAGAGFLTLGALLAGCDKGGGDAAGGAAGGEAPKGEAPSAALDCTDVSGLSEADKKTRDAFKYVEKSPDPKKLCSNCQLYLQPEGGSGCGGCTIVKGPINPDGYCASWVPQTG